MNGKGDKRRPGDGYASGWDKIYKRKTKMMWLAAFKWEILKLIIVIGFGLLVLKISGVL